MMIVHRVEHADQANKSYHRATLAGDFVFPCGQIPVDSAGNTPETIGQQTRLVIDNLEQVLLECGSSLDAVVQVTVFLSSVDDFDDYDAAWRERFGADRLPPRTTLFVAGFRGAKRIELTAIAAKTSAGESDGR